MRQPFWFLVPLAIITLVIAAACDDNYDGDNTDAARTQVNEVATNVKDAASNLSNDIDNGLDNANNDLAKVDDKTKDRWNEDCQQMAESEADLSTSNELRDVCGDLKQGLEENSRDLVNRAREALDDLAS